MSSNSQTRLFPPQYLDDLNKFAAHVWDNPDALREPLPGAQGVEFVDLGQFFNAFEYLCSGILKHSKILIRNEYNVALRALQTDKLYERGAYISGQPGIGKTYFLIYALVHFLGCRQPVAMQPLNGRSCYLIFRDTVTCHPIWDDDLLFKCGFVWALCDSNSHIQVPAGVFLTNPNEVRIIQATSPKASRWKEWSKQIGAECYIMDLWTEEEVKHLAKLLEMDVNRMSTLARMWGPNPRLLISHFDDSNDDIKEMYEGLAGVAVTECRKFISESVNLSVSAPSAFYCIRPAKTSMGVITRKRASVSVPTRTLRHILAKALMGQNNDIKLQFYFALSQPPWTRQAAGYIYESWFHSFISAGHGLQCQWLEDASEHDRPQLPTSITGTTNLIPATESSPGVATPPYYWIPPRSNFPGIDSALVLEDAIFAFQVTISGHHKSPKKDLDEFRQKLSSEQKALPLRAVFVGASQGAIEKVAREWAKKLQSFFPIAWSVVDPVQAGVDYKVYRDESDEETMEMQEVE